MDIPHIMVGILLVSLGISCIMGQSDRSDRLPSGREFWHLSLSPERTLRIICKILRIPILLWGLYILYVGLSAEKMEVVLN